MNSRPPHSNPFASRYVRPGEIVFHASDPTCPPLDGIVTRLQSVRYGAIVGNHGTGKSTLLRELAATLARTMPGGHWVQLTQESSGSDVRSRSIAHRLRRVVARIRETILNVRTLTRLQNRVAPGGVLVIDGAEQIPSVYRRWMLARARRRKHFCLLTSHHELAGCQTLYRTRLSRELITTLLHELLPPPTNLENIALRTHLQNHLDTIDLDQVSNLRDLWDELYDVVEAFESGSRD